MFKVGDSITGHDFGTGKLVKGNIVRVDTSDFYAPYKILTTEGDYCTWVKDFGARRIPSDFILKDIYLDELKFQFNHLTNLVEVYKMNVHEKITGLKIEHLQYLKDMIEIYQERYAKYQFYDKRTVERYKGVNFEFELLNSTCPKLHFELEGRFFAYKLDNKYLLNEDLDNFYNWLEEAIEILNENIQHEPAQPVDKVINDVMEDHEIETPITGEPIQNDILEATKVFKKWLTRVLDENEELSEKQKVAFMIQQLSSKMYVGQSKLILSIPYRVYYQLNKEESNTLGKHANTFITLLATTNYKDLVKLAKPKYIISVGSPDYDKNYIAHVTPEDNHGLLGKYQTTKDKEKAIVFGNKENAENFIKNNLNPNRNFEVITK